MFATRRALGAARREAAASRVRITELEQGLAALIAQVDGLPRTIEFQPSTQARTNLREGRPVTVRVPYLAAGAPLNLAVRDAMMTLAGVR